MLKGRHFDRSVILLWVRWYLAYNHSLRDLEELMTERGIRVDHSTIILRQFDFTEQGNGFETPGRLDNSSSDVVPQPHKLFRRTISAKERNIL